MGRRRIRAAEVTRRTQPTESAQWGSYGLFTTEEPSMGPARIYSRPSACMLCLLTWCFGGTYNSGSRCVSDSFACSWDAFPPIRLSCLAQYEDFCLVLTVSYFAMFGCRLLEVNSFMKGNEREWISGRGEVGTELEEGERRETVVGIWEKSTFQ